MNDELNLDVARICADCLDTLPSGPPRHYVLEGSVLKVVCADCAGWYRVPIDLTEPPAEGPLWK
jgi:hypothetical protein